MELTDFSPAPNVTAEPGVAAESDTFQRCDECGAPVDKDQRYCVSCGAHRRHVNDPAARYLSQATARARSKKAGSTARTAPSGGIRSRGLGLALAIALVPVAAAAGVIAGRSSNNNDSQLVRALAQHQSAAAPTTTVTAAATSHQSADTTSTAARKKSKHHARKAPKSPSTKNAGKVLSKTANGSAQQITGFKPTKSQVQQGQSETQKVQKSTGKSYVAGQNNLPSQVVVP